MSETRVPEEVPKRRLELYKTCNRAYAAEKARVYRLRKKTEPCRIKGKTTNIHVKRKIEEALENADSSSPMFVLKESKIQGAGKGVFVSAGYERANEGTLIPYCGRVSDTLSQNYQNREYQVELKKGQWLIGTKHYSKGQPLGNFINRVAGDDIVKAGIAEDAEGQDLQTKNAELIVLEGVAYFRLLENVPSGYEILTTYGSSFRIPKPIVK